MVFQDREKNCLEKCKLNLIRWELGRWFVEIDCDDPQHTKLIATVDDVDDGDRP